MNMSQANKMNVFEYMELRFHWEELVRGYKLPTHDGTVDNLSWFVENGAKSNRFRENFTEAMDKAKEILSRVTG